MQKVTLVNPQRFSDYPQPPMGLILLASVLESKGYPVNHAPGQYKNQNEEAVTNILFV